MADEHDKNPESTKEPSAPEATEDNAADTRYITNDGLNKALAAYSKRILDKQTKQTEELMAKVLAAKEAAQVEKEEVEVTSKNASKGELEAKKAQAMIAEMRKEQAEKDKLRDQEIERARAATERTAIESALSGLGLGSIAIKQATIVLKNGGFISRNDAGEPVFMTKKEYGGEVIEEPVSLNVGLRDWLASEDGKLYQPAKGVEGSGASNQGAPRRGNPTRDQRRAEATATLLNWVKNRR